MTPHTSPDMLAYYAARAPSYDAVYRRPEWQDDTAFFPRHIPQRLAWRRVLKNFPDEAELRSLLSPLVVHMQYVLREHFWLL